MNLASWYEIKQLVEGVSGISMDALHILVGFLIFLFVAGLLKRGIGSVAPWLALLALELANEAYDLYVERWPDLAHQFAEGAKDIALTMAIPTLAMLIARYRPNWIIRTNRTG